MIIRPSALGDVCRTVPVLASLRAAYPGAEINWLVQDVFAPAVASHPALSRVVPFPRAQVSVGRWWKASARARLKRLFRELRDARYDRVYDCQGLGRSGFFAWVTRAPDRFGYANAREMGFLGLNHRVHVERDMHTVDRMLALIERSGTPVLRDMRLYASDEDRDAVDERLAGVRYAVLAPTSRWEGKRWSADRFGRLAAALLSEGAVERVALVGSSAERSQIAPLLESARADTRIVDLVGHTGVGALMATIESSAIVVANDSAALHMAVGFDRPLVGLYGPTRVDLVGPYQRQRDVIQAHTPPATNQHKSERFGRIAMEAITVERVVQAALERLAAPAAAAQR